MDEFSKILANNTRIKQKAERLRKVHLEKQVTFGKGHALGKPNCFCHDCLVYRNEDWRIGNINIKVAGPRQPWIQFVWGNNERGALGLSEKNEFIKEPVLCPSVSEAVHTMSIEGIPLKIHRDAKFVKVATGMYHTLYLSESKKVFAFGDYSHGALGLDSKNDVSMPTEVPIVLPDGEFMVDIATGAFSSYAISDSSVYDGTENGKMYAAKSKLTKAQEYCAKNGNSVGALSMLSEAQRQLASTLVAVRQEIGQDCKVYAWGRDVCGCLGHGDSTSYKTPTIIQSLVGIKIVKIAAGSQHVLLQSELEGCFAFGNNSKGQLGLGDLKHRHSPVKMEAFENMYIVQLEAGGEHSCALTGYKLDHRQVYSWGNGQNGRLGHDDEQDLSTPVSILELKGKKIIEISCGIAHTLALSDSSLYAHGGTTLWSFGNGTYGQLGHRHVYDSLAPRALRDFRREKIIKIQAGGRQSIVMTADGEVFSWGLGASGTYLHHDIDPRSNILTYPKKVDIPDMHKIGICSGYGRNFIWGDRATYGIYQNPKARIRGVCSASPFRKPGITSHALRVLYHCGTCQMSLICPVCAEFCHHKHCIKLYWTDQDTLSTKCSCFDSKKCTAISDKLPKRAQPF